MWCVCEGFVEARLDECEFEGAEFAGDELDDFVGWGWREDEGVDTVDYAVGSKLEVDVSKS